MTNETFDLNALGIDTDETTDVPLLNPATGEPVVDRNGTPSWIRVTGLDSPQYKAHERAMLNRRLKQRNPKATMTAEQISEERLAMLSACTVQWHLVTLDGAVIDVPCTPENARKLYANPKCGWITRQVDRAIGDDAVFMKNSSTA